MNSFTAQFKELIQQVLLQLWQTKQRITYRDFELAINEKGQTQNPIQIPQYTFYRLLQRFLEKEKVVKPTIAQLQNIMRTESKEAIRQGISSRDELRVYLYKFLRKNRIYLSAPTKRKRIIGEAVNEAFKQSMHESIDEISKSIGYSVHSLRLIDRALSQRQYERFPPVYKGKLGVRKLQAESAILRRIQDLFQHEGIELSVLLEYGGIHESKVLIETYHPSDLFRTSREFLTEHLLKYYAARYQDAIDAMIKCYIKCARLMRFRTKQDYEERADKESRRFLEQAEPHFQAILEAMKTGNISILDNYTKFLELVVAKTRYYHNRSGYYDALAARYTYSRRLSTKLSLLKLQGLDCSARHLVVTLREVFERRRFSERVPNSVIERLGFLQAPKQRLKDRKVFEPLILVTLADYIAGGRVVVADSRQYRNIWLDVPAMTEVRVDINNVITKMGAKLDAHWEQFNRYVELHPEICSCGKIVHKRLPSSKDRAKERVRKKEIDAFLEALEEKEISEILWSVHKQTGFLDAFRLTNTYYHGHILTEKERQRLAMATVLARGMNIGLKGIVKALDAEYTIGRLTNFDENYVSIRNLRDANYSIIQAWDRLNLGHLWGDGSSCSSDGKVMFSFLNNLLSRFHYRKGRMGVTIYWFVRNDWIANYVQIIGNDEWESWYIIDGLLNSLCDKEVRQSCGDTQAQLLSLWGLGTLLGLDIRARFRDIKNISLYESGKSTEIGGLDSIGLIDWGLIQQTLPSIMKLVRAIENQNLASKGFVGTWNIYDDTGNNIAEGLREMGKVYRTIFLLRYLMDKELQQEIREGCNRAEFWNKFQDAVFWGRKGVISSNNPLRQAHSSLFLMLVMNAIVFYNRFYLGDHMKNELGHLDYHPVFWQYINFIGRFCVD